MRTVIGTLAVCATVALFGFGLASCGGGKDGKSADTLERIKKEGTLKWGADNSGGAPFVFLDPKDKKTVIGFEMDIMDKLSGHVGVKHQQIQAVWDALIDDMGRNSSDMVMNGIEVNEDRKKVVLLSEPYYIYEQQITVRAADKDKYKTLDDLKGKNIATLKGAEANNVLKEKGFTDDQIKPQDDSSLPYEELKNKRVEAVLQESIIAAYYAGPVPELYNVPATFSPGKYAVAIRKGDETLLKEINAKLDVMKKNGELAAIYKKWNIWNDKQKELGIVEK